MKIRKLFVSSLLVSSIIIVTGAGQAAQDGARGIFTEETCAKEGEMFSNVYSDYPDHCCDGLTEWYSGMDTRISIGDECYENVFIAGAPYGLCINCGNGICEDIEDVCNCLEDCAEGENSDYAGVDEFCSSEFWISVMSSACEEEPVNLPICDLCNARITTTTTINEPLPDTTTTTAASNDCPVEQIYGEHSEEIELLRYFRDNVLNQSPEGMELIRLYYESSSVIVETMEEDEEFKEDMREVVDCLLILMGGRSGIYFP